MAAPDPKKFKDITNYGDPNEPYRCIRTFVEPGTSKITSKEYICYPPKPCPPIEPTLIPPRKCNPCVDCKSPKSPICEAVKRVQENRYGLSDLPSSEEMKKMLECKPVTVCVPAPEPPPPFPSSISPHCTKYNPKAIEKANSPEVSKYFFETHKRMQKEREEWEKRQSERKMKIKRFC